MTLNNEQDAINQAVEAGYNRYPMPMTILPSPTGMGHGNSIPNFDVISQDLAFWSALGKARGWEDTDGALIVFGIWKKYHGREPDGEDELTEYEEREAPLWKFYAHRYFETRLSNGDMQAYWESLP